MGMLVFGEDQGVFWDKNKRDTATHRVEILEENLLQCAFQQTLGDKFTFQQDNNLKRKATSTLELLTKTTLNVRILT